VVKVKRQIKAFDIDNADAMIRMVPSRPNNFGMKGYGNER
jgi:hypothetical protein